MRSTNHRTESLPTGEWLAEQRERHLKTLGQVAKAVNRHTLTVLAVERNDRVIPPGWSEGLKTLGMTLPAPVWPVEMPFYFGTDLKRDMRKCAGMRNSQYWLSQQLGVSEKAVAAIVRDNLVVPQNWLLKLAEMGASVPTVVHMALTDRVEFGVPMPDFAERLSTPEHGAEPVPESSPGTSHFSDEPASSNKGAETRSGEDEPSTCSSPEFIAFKWSREEGLQFNLSTPLLEQIAVGIKDLLILYQNGLLETTQRKVDPSSEEPSHG